MYDYEEMDRMYRAMKTCKTLNRFALEDIIKPESIASHSFGVALFVCIISSWMKEHMPEVMENVDPKALTVEALFHDYDEILTGDLNYWVKNHDEAFKREWNRMTANRLSTHLRGLPEFFRNTVLTCTPHSDPSPVEMYILKCSDYLDFTFKAMHEASLGNREGMRLMKVGLMVIDKYRNREFEQAGHPVLDMVAYLKASVRRVCNADYQ